jgi:hypothetical protein
LKNAKAQEPRRAGALVLKRPSISVADFYSGAMAELCSGVDRMAEQGFGSGIVVNVFDGLYTLEKIIKRCLKCKVGSGDVFEAKGKGALDGGLIAFECCALVAIHQGRPVKIVGLFQLVAFVPGFENVGGLKGKPDRAARVDARKLGGDPSVVVIAFVALLQVTVAVAHLEGVYREIDDDGLWPGL